ncbi:VOC family protein [Candidatus Micrarchaeota archaeon]|nr:VOC family protein [Candidatus Micrarchaeota archaeon]
MTVGFELEGQHFTTLNGGPYFKFTPAVSFFVGCGTEKEMDALWAKLSKGGRRLWGLGNLPRTPKTPSTHTRTSAL